MKALTLTGFVNAAKVSTSKVANLKDYQVRNKNLRAKRELARELANGKGYIIATAKEISDRYNLGWNVVKEDLNKKRVWGLCYSFERFPRFSKITFVAFC